jgi:hypothetical protein
MNDFVHKSYRNNEQMTESLHLIQQSTITVSIKPLFIQILAISVSGWLQSIQSGKTEGMDVNTVTFIRLTLNGKQHMVTWHVDNIKSSHIDPKVNDEFLLSLETNYDNKDIAW